MARHDTTCYVANAFRPRKICSAVNLVVSNVQTDKSNVKTVYVTQTRTHTACFFAFYMYIPGVYTQSTAPSSISNHHQFLVRNDGTSSTHYV